MTQGSYGFNVQIQTGMDLSTATAIRVRVLRADGSRYDKTYDASAIAAITVNGLTVYTVAYTVETGDLTVNGPYQIEVIDETPGRHIISENGSFNVNAAILAP